LRSTVAPRGAVSDDLVIIIIMTVVVVMSLFAINIIIEFDILTVFYFTSYTVISHVLPD